MVSPRSVDRGARAWSVWFLALALGSSLMLPGACRPPSAAAQPPPVRVAIGYADTRKGTSPDSGIGSLVPLLQDDQLVRGSRDGRPQPALAERWEKSAYGTAWTFYLRPGCRFHDGTPLEASVVAAGLRAALGTSRMLVGMRDITAIEARAPLELVIHLRRPSALLLPSLGNFSIRAAGPKNSSIGAFHLVSRTAEHATLEAFTGDSRPRSNVDQVDIGLYPSGRNAWSAMMRGEVDFLYEVSPEALEFVEQSSQAQLKSYLRPYVAMLGINLRHPILGSREVRLALNTAVNREDIIKVVFRGRGLPATGHVWPRHWAYDHRLAPFRYAPSEALRMLDAAALPVKPSTDRRMPSRFRFTCLLPMGDDRFERMGLMLQRQLIDVGIDMQLEPLSVKALGERLQSGQFDAYLLEMVALSVDWTYFFWHSSEPPSPALLNSGYQAADPMLDRLRAARTDEDMRSAVVSVQHIMRDDPPAVFICWSQIARAVSARFRLPMVPDRDLMGTLPQWQLAAHVPGLLPRQPLFPAWPGSSTALAMGVSAASGEAWSPASP
jgi:ABC-type transport system substrate-binding protein